uniref:Uncharacterized protein n=1 Tax=Steinernema glaseri TaxID=37863 RepID=A0A1I7YM42_9BILA
MYRFRSVTGPSDFGTRVISEAQTEASDNGDQLTRRGGGEERAEMCQGGRVPMARGSGARLWAVNAPSTAPGAKGPKLSRSAGIGPAANDGGSGD